MRYIPVLLLASFLPVSAMAIDEHASVLTVHGDAISRLQPDQAKVPVTVESEGKELAKAKSDNDAKVRLVMDIAGQYGAGKSDVQTLYSFVQPKVDYGQDVTTESDVFTGYLSVRIDVSRIDSAKVDTLVEALQKAELDNISNNQQANRSSLNAGYNVKDTSIEALREKLRQKEAEIIKLAADAGVSADNIAITKNQSKGKERHSEPNKPHITGYTASVQLEVTLKDKDKAVSLINSLVRENIDKIGSVDFSLHDEKAAKEETLLKALKDAREKAEKVAASMNMSIDRPLSIEESGVQMIPATPIYPRFRNPMMANMAATDAAPAPAPQDALPSGLIEINQTVQVTFLLKQK